jgi:hypothetical protein
MGASPRPGCQVEVANEEYPRFLSAREMVDGLASIGTAWLAVAGGDRCVRFRRRSRSVVVRGVPETAANHSSGARLTKPHSPTTTGKIERWHQTLGRELLDPAGPCVDLPSAQSRDSRGGPRSQPPQGMPSTIRRRPSRGRSIRRQGAGISGWQGRFPGRGTGGPRGVRSTAALTRGCAETCRLTSLFGLRCCSRFILKAPLPPLTLSVGGTARHKR